MQQQTFIYNLRVLVEEISIQVYANFELYIAKNTSSNI